MIATNVIPDFFIGGLIANDVVMERPLPDLKGRVDLMNSPAGTGFEKPDNGGDWKLFFRRHYHKNSMDMIWHYMENIYSHIGMMLWNTKQFFINNFAKRIQTSGRTENTLLFMGTNGDKVIILGGIVEVWDSGWFAHILAHHSTSWYGIVKICPSRSNFHPGGSRPSPTSITHIWGMSRHGRIDKFFLHCVKDAKDGGKFRGFMV